MTKTSFWNWATWYRPGTESWDHCFKSSQQNTGWTWGLRSDQTDWHDNLNKMGKHLTHHKAHLSHSSFLVLGEFNARISLPRKWKSDAKALISHHPIWQKKITGQCLMSGVVIAKASLSPHIQQKANKSKQKRTPKSHGNIKSSPFKNLLTRAAWTSYPDYLCKVKLESKQQVSDITITSALPNTEINPTKTNAQY